MEEPVPQIECPLDLFPKQEVRIQNLTNRINEANEFPQKAELARAFEAQCSFHPAQE